MTSVPPAVSDGARDPTMSGDAPADQWPPPAPASWHPEVRAGQLNAVWRSALAICWIGVFFAFAAVWKASEEIGIATWWLGPRSDPQPVLIRLSPFLLALGVGLVVISNLRHAVWVSYAGALLIAVLAALDVSRSAGLAVIEFAIAGAVVLVTTASLSGRYRAVKRPATPDDAGNESAPER
ncbi:MAG: hypothetical protein QNM02_17320 [Acidimicrobiia bacterium]|nr:hypothetical protein [Acidimicrobiia bacterium]